MFRCAATRYRSKNQCFTDPDRIGTTHLFYGHNLFPLRRQSFKGRQVLMVIHIQYAAVFPHDDPGVGADNGLKQFVICVVKWIIGTYFFGKIARSANGLMPF